MRYPQVIMDIMAFNIFNTKMIIRDLDDWSLPTVERNDVAEMGVPPVIIHL